MNADAREGLKYYDEFKRAGDRLLQKTDIRGARWQLVDGGDPNYALAVGHAVRDAIRQRLHKKKSRPKLVEKDWPPRAQRVDSVGHGTAGVQEGVSSPA